MTLVVDANIKTSDNVLLALHQQQLKERNTSSLSIPEVACVLMKSLVYGFQKAINEFTLKKPEFNLSKPIENIDINGYIDSYCAEYLKAYPNAVNNQSIQHDSNKRNQDKATVKVKRHQPNQQSVHMKSKAINETTPIINTNDHTLVNDEGSHWKQEKRGENNHDQLGRLLKSIQEVTNAIRSQLTRESHKESQSVLGGIAESNKKQDIGDSIQPIKSTNENYQHSHSNQAYTPQKPTMHNNLNSKKVEKPESTLPAKVDSTNATSITSDKAENPGKNTTDVKSGKSKHHHHHHHYHNLHNRNKAPKSKASPAESKMKDAAEDELDFNDDDMYVSAQLKLDELTDKLKMRSKDNTKEKAKNMKENSKQIKSEKEGIYRSKRSVKTFGKDKEVKNRNKLFGKKVKQVKNAEMTKLYRNKEKSYKDKN